MHGINKTKFLSRFILYGLDWDEPTTSVLLTESICWLHFSDVGAVSMAASMLVRKYIGGLVCYFCHQRRYKGKTGHQYIASPTSVVNIDLVDPQMHR